MTPEELEELVGKIKLNPDLTYDYSKLTTTEYQTLTTMSSVMSKSIWQTVHWLRNWARGRHIEKEIINESALVKTS